MSHARRWSLGVFVVILVVVGAVLFLRSSLDDIVRKAIERTGSEVTDTGVSVASVSLSLREGRGTVRGITVSNPKGFPGDDALRLGTLVLDVDVASLAGDPIVIDEIRVEGPRVVVEPLPDGSVNLDVIRRNAEDYSARGGGKGNKEEPSRRLRIRSLVFEDGQLVLDLEGVGREAKTVDLPGFRLTDLGGTEGAEPGTIGREVVDVLARKALAAAREEMTDQLKEELGKEAEKQAGEAAKGAIDNLLH